MLFVEHGTSILQQILTRGQDSTDRIAEIVRRNLQQLEGVERRHVSGSRRAIPRSVAEKFGQVVLRCFSGYASYRSPSEQPELSSRANSRRSV